jgi:hypothetical protein
MTVNRTPSVVTAERFAEGMTFDQYAAWVGTPENLAREVRASVGVPRRDFSAFFRQAYEMTHLHDAQVEAIRWLAAQPNGPAKILVISEDWSSDCRRDVPTLARFAEVGNMELRIFNRDGETLSASPSPSLAETPARNADIMGEFLNHKNGQTWRSIPVAVFYTKDLEYLYHYTEFPAIYEKDRIVWGHIRPPRPGETKEQTEARVAREFPALQASPFFRIWACAAVDEIVSALHRRLMLGEV